MRDDEARKMLAPGTRWTLRGLPIAGLAVGAAAGRSIPAALTGLVLAFIVAVAASATLILLALHKRTTHAPQAPVVEPDGIARPERPTPDDPPAPPATPSGPALEPTAKPEPDLAPASEPRSPAVEPFDVNGSTFKEARDRAAARHGGVLWGDFYLVDSDLRVRWGQEHGGKVPLLVDDTAPRAADREVEWVPEERITAWVRISTWANHVDGAVLELGQVCDDGTVWAAWWRGENHDLAKTMPSGFTWEKNDDYYRGFVPWSDLSPVSFRVKVISP